MNDPYSEIAARFSAWYQAHPEARRAERIAKFDEIADLILDARDALENMTK